MDKPSHGESDARVYDLLKVTDEHKPLPPTASAQLLKPKPDIEAPKSFAGKMKEMKEGILRWLAPKN